MNTFTYGSLLDFILFHEKNALPMITLTAAKLHFAKSLVALYYERFLFEKPYKNGNFEKSSKKVSFSKLKAQTRYNPTRNLKHEIN